MENRVTRSRRPPPQQYEQQTRARWTKSLTKILVDLMVDQVHKGNRQHNSFGKKAWKYMCDEFYKKSGLKWDKEQLKNRYAVLRRHYVTIKLLLNQSDFTWDETTGTIIGDDEAWAEYIRGHPDAETLKSTGCPIYKELCIIFSEPLANGKHDRLAELDRGTASNPYPPEPEPLCLQQESTSESEEVEVDYVEDPDFSQPATPSITGIRKRGRKGIDDVIAGAILEMAAASKLRTAAIQQCNGRYTITKCIKELDEMQGVDEQLYFAALDLFSKPVAREIFLSLKREKRLTWLRGKCMAHTSETLG